MPTSVDKAAFASGDGIPLMDDAGGGVYTLARNNARDIRQGLLGSRIATNGGPFTPRVGVIPTTRSTGPSGVYSDFQVVGQGSPNTTVTIKAGRAIVIRTGEGPYIVTMTQDQNITMSAANGTNPRWDVIWIKQYDKAAFPADPQHGPWIGVTEGDPAGSPTVPAIPTDAVEITRIRRAAGSPGDQIGSVSTPITDTRKSTGVHGAVRALLPGDALTDAGGYHGELRFRPNPLGGLSPLSELIDRWSQVDSKWHGTQNVPLHIPTQTFSTIIANASTATIASVTIPDIGWDWHINASGGFEYLCADANALVGCQVTVDSTVVDANVAARGLDKSPGGVGESKYCGAIPTTLPIPGGVSRTIRLLGRNYSSAAGVDVELGGQYGFHIEIVPI